VRVRTPGDIVNEQTIEVLALRIWTAMVGAKFIEDMSNLMDELLQSHLLDDDDEENDEGWLDDHHKRAKKLLDEAIADGLQKYPNINTIDNLPINSDPDIANDAERLKSILAQCAIGATKFKEKFTHESLERQVRGYFKKRLEEDPRYCQHVRGDVPGTNIRKYGDKLCTSSKGTFVKTSSFEAGGGLDALFTGGWLRVAKDSIDPIAWSRQYGLQRKTERQAWRHCFIITERNGHQSSFELARETLAGTGASAVRLLTRAGVHVVRREGIQKALVQFLYFKPTHEIIRMPHVGWAQVGSHWIFVRPEEVITPADMPQARHTSYLLDTTATRHGLHVTGTCPHLGTPTRCQADRE
jgi:hypothetical protein